MDFDDVKVTAVAEVGADLGEGPSWDERSGTVLFVDISPGIIYRLDPDSGALTEFGVGQEVGAVVPRAAGGLVVAMRDGIGILDDGSESVRMIAPIEGDDPGKRMNDAKCDPQGRLWAGTMAFDFHAGGGALYRLDADHSVTTIAPDVTIANGLGWSPQGDTMYHIDSMNYGVDAYPFDGATGALGEGRRVIQFSEDDGLPDGLTVDAEGGIWVALFGGGAMRRFHADGTPWGSLSLPATQITSACFGGADLGDLYITSAAFQLDEAALAQQPLAGSLFVCRPGVAGQSTNMFAG
jgi:sugar lactone lactonase YvrE